MTPRAILPRRVLAVAIAGLAIWLALNRDSLGRGPIESSIRDLGLWASPAHVGLFALATVFFVPGTLTYTWLGHAGREALAGGTPPLPRLVRRNRAAGPGELARKRRSGAEL